MNLTTSPLHYHIKQNAILSKLAHHYNGNSGTHSQKELQKLHDAILLESTERCLAEPNFSLDGDIIPGGQWLMNKFQCKKSALQMFDIIASSERKLFKPNRCYICKQLYQSVHHHYHRLCNECSSFNFQRRSDKADLNGRIALLTGGRVKIGFQIALKLLRAGAKVIVTSRFKYDTARRYMLEHDYEDWADNLIIYGLDLKHIPSVESFIEYIVKRYDKLDILINNAAQTIKKPQSYYQEMAKRENALLECVDRNLLSHFLDPQLESENHHWLTYSRLSKPSVIDSTMLDEFSEPVDISPQNSWTKTAENIDTLEFLETQTINTTAPFLLCTKLKSLLQKSSLERKFIINVSAMEGQFNRKNKTHRHPHTNMAKAALNMMTRTIASDYVKQDIYVNSVDTGWVTQENPLPIKSRNRAIGVVPPLDCIDGAARVLAPIFEAINGATPTYGRFLKDYHECAW
ncbi:SDR family NAD(P)-dependent oxidoreductase [Pseudoalteromonas luteoviolacea]|uniref:SDR family NAD(P)-dependent oxidoreductase n=1 Tax=Pseudoalteromonas luteoviolacea TaxID=43657 RepID=UPI001B388F81|nr:SDR family oxidoreductase [Pseudoalteromonas luteoviolacea]MBQ4837541.1 SDR family oxidoreductase [Pseudoalteromonas luteoviolacea]